MVVSRGLAGFSRGREHLAVVSRAVVTVVRGQSFSDMVHVIFSRNAFFAEKKVQGTRVSGRGHGFLGGDTGFWEGTRVSGRGHGFLAGDTGFWQGTRVSGMPKHIKTHIKHLETHIKHLETHKNTYKRI